MPRTELRARARLPLCTAVCLSVLALAAACVLVPALAETSTCETHMLDAVDAVDATCTEDGTEAYWVCSVCGALFSDADATTQIDEPVAIAATGHDYSYECTWEWESDTDEDGTVSYGAAEYTLIGTCTRDSSHTDSVTGYGSISVKYSTEVRTCTMTTVITHTATVTYEDVTYTDTQTVTIEEATHSYTYAYSSGTWEWTGTAAATYTYTGTCKYSSSHKTSVMVDATVESATEAATCTHDPSFIVVVDAAEATCTEPATASCWQCSACGTYFSDADATTEIDASEVTGDATGHSWRYAAGEFVFSDDCATAVFSVPCSNGCGDTLELDAAVSTSTVSATCLAAGSVTYTATYTVDGLTYSSTYTKLIAMTDHDIDLSSANWTWASDHSSATVSAVCKVCGSTVELSADSVTSEVTTAATATSTGVRTWTASVTYGGEPCTATDVETLAVLTDSSGTTSSSGTTGSSKLTNTLAVKGKTASVRVAFLKKRAVKLAVSKVMRVTGAKGTVAYKRKSGDKALTVNKKTGAVTVKKGARKGVHKLKIAVTAAGTSSYAAVTKVVTIKVRVR